MAGIIPGKRAGLDSMARLVNSPRPIMQPTTAFTAALVAGSVKVVVVGDSISEGADMHYPNNWVANMTEMLNQQFPSITWDVVNLSLVSKNATNLADANFVGGDGTGNTFTRSAFPHTDMANGLSSYVRNQVWPNGSTAGLSWRDHVKALAPDFVIVALGMNDGDEVNFVNNLTTFETYTKTWPKVPMLGVLTTYLPTNALNPWASDGSQPIAQAIADATRSLSLKKGWALIDPNAIYRMLRDGVAVDYALTQVEKDFRYWGDASSWTASGGAAMNAGVLTGAAGGFQALRRAKARDVDISARFTLTTATAVPQFTLRQFNEADSLSGLTVQLFQSAIELYSKNVSLYSVPIGHAVQAGEQVRIRVKATAGLVKVWVNDVLLIRSKNDNIVHRHGAFAVGLANATGSIDKLEAHYATERAITPPLYDQGYLLGTVQYGDVDTNVDSIGGNAINHPSDFGARAFHVPAVSQLIADLRAKADYWIAQATSAAASVPTAYVPVLQLFNGTQPFTHAQQKGTYSKMGRVVVVQGTVQLSASAPTNGSAVCVNLPFNGGNGVGDQSLTVGLAINVVGGGTPKTYSLVLQSGTNKAILRCLDPTTGAYMEVTTVNNNALLEFGGIYITDQ